MADRRTRAKLIRFHPDELRRITESARRAGLTSARYIREAALGAIPKARRTTQAAPLLRELARVGRSLEQLARTAQGRPDATFAAHLREALDGHAALVRDVVAGHRQTRGSLG